MKNKLLILGSGGHGRVIADVAERTKFFQKISFLDDSFLNSNSSKLVNSTKVIEGLPIFILLSYILIEEPTFSSGKGHKESLSVFFDYVRDKTQNPFTWEEIKAVSKAAIIAQNHINSGQQHRV